MLPLISALLNHTNASILQLFHTQYSGTLNYTLFMSFAMKGFGYNENKTIFDLTIMF